MRRGSRRSFRFARLELELITPLRTDALIATFRCAAPARRRAVADVRRVGGGDEGGGVRTRKRSSRPLGQCGSADTAPFGDRVAANGSSSRRAIRFTRPDRELMPPFRTGVLIATFRRDAPARCGALADDARIVAGGMLANVLSRD
jgi:hypothetical protein